MCTATTINKHLSIATSIMDS
ncbi:hypothetical protein OOU_Y34scaffold01112g4 [Pyricularia oryzae Y34]|uniref:Uncharacterized protein n=1 Tax=Pyricularia oryzae (strain Y34) TaxID=1143189 RepID=A0AA97NLT6_PYRO3|nr:hypothetical protein OOU_Y34scaffold01112g4 [Pyricularia oryzae Y34]